MTRPVTIIKYLLSVTCVVLMALTFDSCGSHKTTSQVQPQPGVSTPVKGDYSDRFMSIAQADAEWQRVKMPVTLRLTSPSRATVSGTAVMVRDTSIFISLRMFGFEVAQLYVTDDMVTVIDKYHKKYFTKPTASLLRGYSLKVSNLQSLLLGQPFIAGKNDVTVKDMSKLVCSKGDGDFWTAAARSADGFDYGFVFNSGDILTGFAVESPLMEGVATCGYNAPKTVGNASFAGLVTMNVPLGKSKSVACEFEWSLSKARWGSEVEVKEVTVPQGYTSLSSDEVLKLFGK